MSNDKNNTLAYSLAPTPRRAFGRIHRIRSLQHKWKKHSEEMQTLCAGCSKAEPKFFTPPQTHFPGVWDGQNLISWRWSIPLPRDPVWWRL